MAVTPGSPRRGDAGQSTLEFALVLPLLTVLVLGLLQGLILGVEAARVSGAAREAARAASVGRDADGVRAAAVRGGGGLDPDRLTVSLSPDPPATGKPATVRVTYRTRPFVPGAAHLGLLPDELTAEATMLVE